jgi:protein TonB
VAVLDRIPAGPFGVPEGVEEGRLRPAVLSVRQLDAMPRPRVRVAPAYPASARAAGRSGDVLVDFMVDETGHVTAPRVIESSDPEFEEPALRAVAKWVFEPGKKNGRVVRFRMQVPVTFRLAD